MLQNATTDFAAMRSPLASPVLSLIPARHETRASVHLGPDTGAAGSSSPRPPDVLRVLVVEDVLDVAHNLEATLRSWGHDSRICTSGSESLALAAYYEPHVILIDIGLPDMTGWDLAQKLREQNLGERPVMIAVTAYGEQSDFERSQRAGISFHLVKPAFHTQLKQVLERIDLRSKQFFPSPLSDAEIEKHAQQISFNARALGHDNRRAFIIAACRDLLNSGVQSDSVREIERQAFEPRGTHRPSP